LPGVTSFALFFGNRLILRFDDVLTAVFSLA